MTKEEFDFAIEEASISISENEERYLIKSIFKFMNTSNIGILFFLIISLFLLIITFTKGEDWISIVSGSVFSGSFFIFSVMGLLKQVTDFVEVTNDEIKFMNSLRVKKFPLDSEMKIKVVARTEYIKMKSIRGSGSFFRHIEIYLTYKKEEYRIFNFQVDDKYSSEANKLGSEIVHKIKKRINAH